MKGRMGQWINSWIDGRKEGRTIVDGWMNRWK